MLKHFVFIILFVLYAIPSISQSASIEEILTKADSLLQHNNEQKAIETLTQVDSVLITNTTPSQQILYYKLLGESYLNEGNYELAIAAYQVLVSINSDTKETHLMIARGLNDLGIAYYKVGEMNKAVRAHRQSILLYKQQNDLQGLAFNYNNLAIIKKEIQEIDSAIFYHNESSSMAEKVNDTLGIGYNNLNIAILYSDNQQPIKGIDYFLKSLRAFSGKKYLRQQYLVGIRLAGTYSNLGDKAKAKATLFNIEKKAQDQLKVHQKINLYNRLSYIYLHANELDSAEHYINISVELSEQSQSIKLKGAVYELVGRLAFKHRNMEEAMKAFDNGLEVISGKYKGLENSIHVNRAKVFGHQGKNKKVIALLEHMANKKDHLPASTASTVYNLLYEAYDAVNNPKKALNYHKLLLKSQKEIYNKENRLAIARLEYDFELAQETQRIEVLQEKKNLEYQQEIEKQRLIQYAAFGAVLLISIISLVIYRSYRVKQQDNKLLSHQAEMLALKHEELQVMQEKEREIMEESIANKERQLATTTMLSHEKNALLNQLLAQLEKVKENVSDEGLQDLRNANKLIQNNLNLQNSWEIFIYQFENVHPEFFKAIRAHQPDLSPAEQKIAAYIKIGLDNKQMAQISNLSLSAVKKGINRLKKRLNLEAEDSIREFIAKF